MDGNYKPYDHIASSERIEEILKQNAQAFEDTDSFPDRDRLTFTNGFYGKCSAVFIDIRDSSRLPSLHKSPTLAKIYRAFISEMVAVLNSVGCVREVNIVGDCVWGVYNTPLKSNIQEVFGVASRANTLLKLLNHHLGKNKITPLRVGIGVDYGRALMIKAGYSGSGINDVVYMGDVVNSAAHLAHEAGRGSNPPIYVGKKFRLNLTQKQKDLLSASFMDNPRDPENPTVVFTGDVIKTEMNKWITELK